MSQLATQLLFNAITAAAAAFAGAYGAWIIARRAEKAESLDSEIVAANNAIGVCSSLANTMVAVKGQRILPMYEAYTAVQKRVADPNIVADGLPLIMPDLQSFSAPFFPIADLKEAISALKRSSRAPMVFASVQLATTNFKDAVEHREEAIKKFQALKTLDERQAYYLGLRINNVTDTHFKDAVKAVSVYCDDILYFSLLLAHVVQRHAEFLRIERGGAAPKVSTLDLSGVPAGLIPSGNQYPDFERQFRTASPSVSRSGWRRLRFSLQSAVRGFHSGWRGSA